MNICFISIFILMLILPLVFIDLRPNRISVGENRMLANRPSLALIKKHPVMFIQQFGEWFKDSTGFREKLLVIHKTFIEKYINNVVQYKDGQYIFLVGENGHYYYGGINGNLIRKFQGKQFLSDEQLLNMASKLEMVKTYLDSKGIPLVVMFCTDKETIYPEYYPKLIKRSPEPIQLDLITDYLKENTNVDIFNIRQALLAEKNNYLLYYKIDTMTYAVNFAHYNEIGAFFAYRELMKHINQYFPKIIPYKLDDIDINYDEREIPNVILKSGFTYQGPDPVMLSNEGIFSFENANKDLPVILFLCDSYSWEVYIGKYFAQQFGKTIFIHYNNISKIQEHIDHFKPDIVVFESAERELGDFANYVIGIPELP